jgi:outer membrane receptor for ferrienterochelin and colicins
MQRKTITIFISLLLYLQGLSQTSTSLTGQITGGSKMQALPGAIVAWEHSSIGTSTDTAGKFTLAWPDSFPATLLIRSVGYRGKGLQFAGKSPTSIRVNLSSGDTLSAVTITDRRNASEFTYLNPIFIESITGNGLRKAACCNLSESFETNPTVDAATTDAVSGAKKIQVLGLDGIYSQILFENLPFIRGMSSSFGLSHVPGTWIRGIQITKGTGSVVNGYESIAGQLNIEILQPAPDADRFFVNLYANQQGRYEMNTHFNKQLNERWATTLLTHVSTLRQRNDMNRDGFLDMPMYTQYNAMNRWNWRSRKNAEGQFGFRFVYDDRTSGEFLFDRKTDIGTTNHFGVGILNRQFELFNKSGLIFDESSLGTMVSARIHNQSMYFGLKKYSGEQRNLYANMIWDGKLWSCENRYRAGLSFLYDEYRESYNDSAFGRTEIVPGAFFEYTGHLTENFTIVAGVRTDMHNLAGTRITPRVHIKYDFGEKSALRISAGQGFRTANIFTENSSIFASAKRVEVTEKLRAESAWNFGGSLQQGFTLFKNEATFIVDFFRTNFTNQVVVDMEQTSVLLFYNLNGKSYANSFQADLVMEPLKDFEVRVAYKFYDVWTTYSGVLKQKPLTARHRAFINLGYALPHDKWTFDFTTKWIGATRIPGQVRSFSKPYYLLSTNVGRKFRRFDVYAGVENILNYRQPNPILGANNPFGTEFDASKIYAPTDGRTIYLGVRFKI